MQRSIQLRSARHDGMSRMAMLPLTQPGKASRRAQGGPQRTCLAAANEKRRADSKPLHSPRPRDGCGGLCGWCGCGGSRWPALVRLALSNF
jgi:hypothetical protein